VTKKVDPKVLARVRKLLALSNDGGATEGEASNAAELARRIMAENGISNATIEASGGEGEGRTSDSRSGHTGKKWMRDIMRALAESSFVIVEYEQGRTARGFEDDERKRIQGKWQLWGRQSAVITVKLMHEYLVRTVDRVARERGTPTDEIFKDAMGTRIAYRISERHESAMYEQARTAREQRAAQAHPGSTSNALVVVLEDYAQKELDLNNDLRNGWAPGTTAAKRTERELEMARRTAEREAQRQALFNEGYDESIVDMVMSGISLERALAIAAEPPKPEKPEKPEDEKAKARREKEQAEWQERWYRQQEKEQRRANSPSARAGRAAGDSVGLDTQVGQHETRKLR
jgi:hypothetical protein